MFGTYDEAVKILEKMLAMYETMENIAEEERETSINTLRLARAAILKEEEEAIKRCETYFDGDSSHQIN